MTVATCSCNWKSLFLSKKPRTLPKLIDGKKSSRSRLRTQRRCRCCRAFVIIESLRLNPWAVRSLSRLAIAISSMQSCKRSESLLCRSFSPLTGALIVRCPPFRLGIWNVLYFDTSGSTYRIYETAFGLKFNSFATSASDVADFRVASLDISYEIRVTHRHSYA